MGFKRMARKGRQRRQGRQRSRGYPHYLGRLLPPEKEERRAYIEDENPSSRNFGKRLVVKIWKRKKGRSTV